MKDISTLDWNILLWAKERKLLGSDSHRQMTKTTEELGEVASAVARGDKELLKDGIGDVYVCLTILAGQNGLSMKDCIERAWNDIKDRKGEMRDGVFVKEADL